MIRTCPPDRGDVVWTDFDPTRGHEQAGKRPALVMSPKRFNKTMGICWVCPITSTPPASLFDLAFTGTRVQGTIRCAQIRTLDWEARRMDKAEHAPLQVVQKAKAIIEQVLNAS